MSALTEERIREIIRSEVGLILRAVSPEMAHAYEREAQLNRKGFRRGPGLTVEEWHASRAAEASPQAPGQTDA